MTTGLTTFQHNAVSAVSVLRVGLDANNARIGYVDPKVQRHSSLQALSGILLVDPKSYIRKAMPDDLGGSRNGITARPTIF